MRAVLLTAWVLVAIASSASGQGLGFGVKGGAAVSTWATEADGDEAPFDSMTGVVAGGFLTWPLGGRLELQPEVLFSQKGVAYDDGGQKLTQRLEYLEVPVLVSYRLFGGAGRQVSAFAGPSLGVRLRARARSSFGDSTLERDITDDVATTDTAIVFGAAYRRGRLVIDGRYGLGLADIDKQSDDGLTVKNRAVSIMAGWRF
jgi:hypothetical protein